MHFHSSPFLVEIPHTEGLERGGGSGVTNPDSGLLGAFDTAEDPPGTPAKDASGIQMRAPGENIPSPRPKNGNEGSLTLERRPESHTPVTSLSQMKLITRHKNIVIVL